MIRLTQSICVTVRTISVPSSEPSITMRHAATLIVIWKTMKRWILIYNDLPHITARAILLNELSRIVMSEASLATVVPSPIERPTWAALRAGASFVPSPVTATTSPSLCNNLTSRSLSIGRALDIILMLWITERASSSERASQSLPVIWLTSLESVPNHKPSWRPISIAVPGVSPVTILTSIPADIQFLTASATSWRIGSAIATTPNKIKFSATRSSVLGSNDCSLGSPTL